MSCPPSSVRGMGSTFSMLSTWHKQIFNTLVLLHLDYCSCVWGTCGVNLQMKLERIQNYAMRLITSAKPRTPSAQLRSEFSWMSLKDRREMQVVSKVHSCLHGRAPTYLCSKFSRNLNAEYRETRGVNNIQLQCPHTNFYRKTFEFNTSQGSGICNHWTGLLDWTTGL